MRDGGEDHEQPAAIVNNRLGMLSFFYHGVTIPSIYTAILCFVRIKETTDNIAVAIITVSYVLVK